MEVRKRRCGNRPSVTTTIVEVKTKRSWFDICVFIQRRLGNKWVKMSFPCIVLFTYGAGGAVELAARVDEALGAVAGDAGAQPGDLLVHPGVVLYTTRDVRPGPVLLQQKIF